jgi:Fusaric acid resistance protein-like
VTAQKSAAWAHAKEVLRWSPDRKVDAVDVLSAALGMAAPVALGVYAGMPPAGLAAALGGLAASRAQPRGDFAARTGQSAAVLIPVICAVIFTIAGDDRGWIKDFLRLVAVSIAALVGSYSRSMAMTGTRFIVFVVIMHAMPEMNVAGGAVLLALVLIGALWTRGLGWALRAFAGRDDNMAPDERERPHGSMRQRIARWRRSLGSLAGWSYSIRITTGLAVSVVLEHLWPSHHLHWVGLTVVLLTPRHRELLSPKTTQRAIGTAIGVTATGIALRAGLPMWAFVVAIALLAGLRPLLHAGNYLLYSVVMTPLVILVIDAGHVPEFGLLLDRLFATALGAALVVAASAALTGLARKPAQA